jgi:hypothetical protein
MGELGTRGTTERVHAGNSPPKVARAALLPDNDILTIGDKNWQSIESTFIEGVYTGTSIFYNEKLLRGEPVRVPTGKQFEEYFYNEVKEFDKSSDYADTLLPAYLFNVTKNLSILVFGKLTKDPVFTQVNEEFMPAIIMQFWHVLLNTVAAYLIQDTYAKAH